MAGDIYDVWARVADIEATSRSGHVEVTVGARGELRTLTLTPQIYRATDPTGLARDILDAIADATDYARRQAFTAMAPLLPGGSSVESADLAFDPLLSHLDRHHTAQRT